MRGRGRRPRS
jgi:hypothetical protein